MSVPPKGQIIILGAGPAGLAAGLQIARQSGAHVTILEKSNQVGGIAGSFSVADMPVDYGSHRLHAACDPTILTDIREMLGEDLLDRPRHGRIRLLGRWVHFPLEPLDLARRLPPSFSLGVGRDAVHGLVRRADHHGAETFASVLERGLGSTICRDFYFPYAQKLWGLPPEELSVTQAYRRVATKSLGSMVRQVLGAPTASSAAGRARTQKGRFYYPRNGFGQICDAYAQAAVKAGAELFLDVDLRSVTTAGGGGCSVIFGQDGRETSMSAGQVWSTIPITALVRLLRPLPPQDQLAALEQVAERIRYRGMLLVYLTLAQSRFTEFDAHYFPSADTPVSRLTEPKNYRLDGQTLEDGDRTVLCAEIPCDVGGPEWAMPDTELAQVVQDALEAAGIGIRSPVIQVVTRRLSQAYPVYRLGYEADLEQLERYVDSREGLLSFGRQGMFMHDNIHHALRVGYAAAACLSDDGHFDRERWRGLRQEFQSQVVED